MNPVKGMDTAPKDGTTIIIVGGWYMYDGQRFDAMPSLAKWQDGKWIMADDHHAEYNEPKGWVDVL